MVSCLKTQAVDVETEATSVEWCPTSGFQQFLICGTYKLIQGNDRIGFLSLLAAAVDGPEGSEERLKICQRLEVGSGILDAKWSPRPLRDHPAVAAVSSKGLLELYGMEDGRLVHAMHSAVGPDDVLALSLDWSSTRDKCEYPSIATSDSAGRVSLFQLDEDRLQPAGSWKAHDYEAWTVAFNYWDPNVVYSGGDDSRFKGWDVRQPPESPTFNSRQHSMGVTSIQSNCWREHLLATGSYDESMALWDARSMKSPLSSIGLGGGIWRIKFNPEEGRYALAACMHGGASVVDCDGPEAPRRVAGYAEHGSMVYGVDWRRSDEPRGPLTVASCSFYDKALHLWKFLPEDAGLQRL